MTTITDEKLADALKENAYLLKRTAELASECDVLRKSNDALVERLQTESDAYSDLRDDLERTSDEVRQLRAALQIAADQLDEVVRDHRCYFGLEDYLALAIKRYRQLARGESLCDE